MKHIALSLGEVEHACVMQAADPLWNPDIYNAVTLWLHGMSMNQEANSVMLSWVQDALAFVHYNPIVTIISVPEYVAAMHDFFG